jgi:hypothetical protein
VKVKTTPVDLKRRYAGDLADIKSRVERLSKRDMPPDERATRTAIAALYEYMRTAAALNPERPTEEGAARASSLGERVAAHASGLLTLETGYQPALVAVASRLSAASAVARRLSDSLRTGDAGRARSALATVEDALVWSAGQLAALLDARAATRGGAGQGVRPGDQRGADYFRRLAAGR